jgi:hypothetical protein
MSASPTKSILLIALALTVGGAALALWLQSERATGESIEVRASDGAELGGRTNTSDASSPERRVELLAPDEDFVEPDLPTTVIWPLEVQLTQISRASFEKMEGEVTVGSGASAAIEGHVWGPTDEGLRARVTFTAGANVGRVLICDAEGALGASDLYPGLGIVSIETPTGMRAEREVRLRSGQTELLNLGFGRPAVVFGKVVDDAGEGIPGAEVTLDGHRAESDEKGEFYFPNIASGMALSTCRKHGYALYRETVPITAGRTIEAHQLQFRLAPAANLELSVEGNAGDSRSPADHLRYVGCVCRRRRDGYCLRYVRVCPA